MKIFLICQRFQRHCWCTLKGQCHKIFASDFFHESSSPKPLKIALVSFPIFSKILGDIRKSWWTTGINDNRGHRYQWHQRQICPPVSTTPAANLPLVATIPVTTLPPVSCVNNTGGKLPPVSTTPASNWPQVSMTPVANNGNNIRLLTSKSEL